MSKSTATKRGQASRVFDAIKARLRKDPDMQRLIFPASFYFWDGDEEESREPSLDQMPAIRLTPNWGPTSRQTPREQLGWQQYDVELWTPGLDIRDMLDLSETLLPILCPVDNDDANAWGQTLRDAGADTGEIEFTQLPTVPLPANVPSDHHYARGQFSLLISLPS
jgi:hypothetical protein